MTIRYGGAFLVLAFVSLLGAADGPIRLPVAPIVPQPLPPAPNPDPISALAADQLYIVDSDTPLIVLASPKGLVSVSEEAGPLKIRGRFVDGTGKVETKTYRGKHIFTIEALGSGRVELLIVPVGAAKEADVIRRVIDVTAGEGPIPPPKPKPEPKPEPKSPVAWVVVVEETAQRTPEIAKVLGDLDYWKGLESKGLRWRFYDRDSKDAKDREYDKLANAVGVPVVILLDAAGKDPRTGGEPVAEKLPLTTAGIDAILKGAGK